MNDLTGGIHQRSAWYCSGPKTPEIEKMEIDKILGMKLIETALPKLETAIVSTSKMDGSLRFYIYYGNLTDVSSKKAFHIQLKHKCLD